MEKTRKQEPQEPKNREIHPLDSNVIFREQILVELRNISNGLTMIAELLNASTILATKNEKD